MAKRDSNEPSDSSEVIDFERPDPERCDRRVETPSSRAPAKAKSPPTAPEAPVAAARRHRLPSLRLVLMAAGILIVAIGSFTYWLRGGHYASSEDAYIESAKVLVTTDVSGIVSEVNVREGEVVRGGQVLFQINPLQFQIALQNAQANLHEGALTIRSMKEDYQVMLSNIAAQQAQVAFDRVTNERNAALIASDTVARETYDQSRYALQLDQAKLTSMSQQAQVQLAKLDGNPNISVTQHPLYRQAKAQVDEAQRQLNDASVRAPFAGIVTQVDALQPGNYLVAQTAALTETGAVALVSDDDMWVIAQMKETALSDVKLGDHVDITVDTYPGRTWSGTVQSISPASSGQFSVLPAENSSGNWVKVVQRVPVRISIVRTAGAPVLRAGMSVSVNIDTGHRRSLADLF